MKELYYISAQPAIPYYTWQVEVMIQNFIKNGIDPSHIHVLAGVGVGGTPKTWKTLRLGYPDVQFFFYEDTRNDHSYPPSIKPHLMGKHLEKLPELQNSAIFYHDCDMVFTKPVDWDKFLSDDVWYLSDTVAYIGAQYIKSKKFGVYEGMCDIIGLPTDIPEGNQLNSGGAQFILKNTDVIYWKKVEKDSNALYRFFQEHQNQHKQTDTYYPIQMWTAEMWATLWNAWYFTHTTKVVPEMDFTWPMNPVVTWETKAIYHNAGVVNTTSGMFYKGLYQNMLPYDTKLTDFDPQKCSYKYVMEVIETGKNSVLLQ